MNIITQLSQWWLTRQQTKQQKKQVKAQDQTTIQVYKNLKQLYHFVKWLNTKGLGNRHQRKAFWSKIKNGEPLLEKTLQNLIKKYAEQVEPKEKKK